MRLEMKPIWGEIELVVEDDDNALVVDVDNPIGSVVGFEVAGGQCLKGLRIFLSVLDSMDPELPETEGEKALGCSSCGMKKRGVRPYLEKEDNMIGCVGLMASNRVSDEQMSCLELLEDEESFIIDVEQGEK